MRAMGMLSGLVFIDNGLDVIVVVSGEEVDPSMIVVSTSIVDVSMFARVKVFVVKIGLGVGLGIARDMVFADIGVEEAGSRRFQH